MHVVDLRLIGGSISYLPEISVDDDGRINENVDALKRAFDMRTRILNFINERGAHILSELRDALVEEIDLIVVALQYRMESV